MTITGVLWLGWVKIPGHVEILPILEIMPTDLSYSTAIGSGLLMSALVLALATTLRGIARSWHRSHEIQLQIATARQRLQELRDTWQDSTHEAAPFQAQLHRWNGLRRFRVIHKTTECDSCVSFYLAPHDGLPVCGFHPGQFLTFSLRIPGRQQRGPDR